MFDHTNDDDMLPFNHLDPEEINDLGIEPIEIEGNPF
jgi:hypothetical protein